MPVVPRLDESCEENGRAQRDLGVIDQQRHTERSGRSGSSSSAIEWNSPSNATVSRPRSLTSSKTDFRRLSCAIFFVEGKAIRE